MDTSSLENLGLTQSEIIVFLTLNKLGSSKAGKIIEKSKLQSPVVHRTFHSLAEKGLITSVKIGKIKEYQAVETKALLNIIEQNKENLLKILPLIESERSSGNRSPKARIYQSKKGVRELLYSLIEENSKELCAYGGPKKSIDILDEFFWDSFHKRRIKKKIKGKFILHQSLKLRAKFVKKFQLTQVKLTDKDFEEVVETFICGNKVAIVLYSEVPFGFLIEEKAIAKSYKRFFDLMWNIIK